MDIESLLRQVPLFGSFNQDEYRTLSRCMSPVALETGQMLFREGEKGSSFYIIIEGRLEVIKSLGTEDERLLQTWGPGNFVGEMSMFDRQGLRVAAVRARERTLALEMSHANFDALLRRQPDLAFEVMRELSLRLRDTDNAIIRDLQEKNRQLAEAYTELKAAQAQVIEKERLERELQVAREIQQSILPASLPPLSTFDLGALMVPARAVGGDLYDVIPVDDDQAAVVIGDVSDKGVPAAIFMALTSSLVRAETHHKVSPASVLTNVNRHLLGMNAYGLFVTLIYGLLDCRARTFTYVRAGHELPLLFSKDGRETRLESGAGQALGILDEVRLDEQTIAIPPGGSLLLFTDGAPDMLDPLGKPFGHDRLRRVARQRRGGTAQEFCQQVWRDVSAFQGGASQADDIALVAICARG